MPFKVKIDHQWDSKLAAKMQIGLLEMSTDIHRRSSYLAPVDTSALVNSGRIDKVTGGYAIRYGGKQVPYARIQELGGLAGVNHSVNIKGRHYLERGAESVVRGNIGKYFK